MNEKRIGIVGGGLSGLTAAFNLNKKGHKTTIIESRDRLGGRIETFDRQGIQFEYGATWLAKHQRHLTSLLEELQLPTKPQYTGKRILYQIGNVMYQDHVRPEENPTLKIDSGSEALIHSLSSRITSSEINLNQLVKSIDFTNSEFVIVKTNANTFEFDALIITLPPNLLVNSIQFIPRLPPELVSVAKATHTWMGESIKVALSFPDIFWRKMEVGTFFSQNGPITELHDHSNQKNILKGFMHPGFADRSLENRKTESIKQLASVFEGIDWSRVQYFDKVWKNDPFTYFKYENEPVPHQNNGNPIYRNHTYDPRMIFAGSETSASTPGYMDGAVESGIFASKKVLEYFSATAI